MNGYLPHQLGLVGLRVVSRLLTAVVSAYEIQSAESDDVRNTYVLVDATQGWKTPDLFTPRVLTREEVLAEENVSYLLSPYPNKKQEEINSNNTEYNPCH